MEPASPRVRLGVIAPARQDTWSPLARTDRRGHAAIRTRFRPLCSAGKGRLGAERDGARQAEPQGCQPTRARTSICGEVWWQIRDKFARNRCLTDRDDPGQATRRHLARITTEDPLQQEPLIVYQNLVKKLLRSYREVVENGLRVELAPGWITGVHSDRRGGRVRIEGLDARAVQFAAYCGRAVPTGSWWTLPGRAADAIRCRAQPMPPRGFEPLSPP
jgi:hypothetical protein